MYISKNGMGEGDHSGPSANLSHSWSVEKRSSVQICGWKSKRGEERTGHVQTPACWKGGGAVLYYVGAQMWLTAAERSHLLEADFTGKAG